MPLPTPFHPRTSALCTSLSYKEWAGYYAVRSYDTTHDPEYHAFRHTAGLLDVTPLCKYRVTGPDAADYLAWVMARDVRKLGKGRVTYCCLCDGDGHVVDDGTVARLADESFRVTTASPSLSWLERHARGHDVAIVDVSAEVAALAVQGPTSRVILEDATRRPLRKLRYFRIREASIGGIPVQISRTGYTGDLGYEVWVDAQHALPIWDAIFEAGRPHGLRPAGLDALDVVRIEAGYMLQDVDYYSSVRCAVASRKSSPFELGLDWTVDLERDAFLGQEALQRERRQGSRWALVGLDIDWEELEALYDEVQLPPQLDSHAWRTPVPVFAGGLQVGRATSGVWSPILKKNLALASIDSRYSKVGTRIAIEHTVEWERRTVKATVVERPFFDPERKRS